MATEYVYLFKAGEYYKIGRTKDVKQRLSSLSLPFRIEVIHTIQTTQSLAHEKVLHNRFAQKRINREWFILSQEDVDWICAISSEDHIPLPLADQVPVEDQEPIAARTHTKRELLEEIESIPPGECDIDEARRITGLSRDALMKLKARGKIRSRVVIMKTVQKQRQVKFMKHEIEALAGRDM